MIKLGKTNLGMAGMARQWFAIASVCLTAQLLSVALLSLALPTVAAAQTAVPPGSVGPTASMPAPFTAAGASADYRVGVGDVLGISVYRSPEMASQLAVATDGTIVFPELGPIHVGDLTTAQIANEIQARLRRAGILTSPQVNVIVVQLRARLVSVMGAVSRPGEYPVDRESMTVSQVLALAGANFGTGDAVVTLIEGNGVGAARSQARIADIVSGSADRAVHNGEVIVVQAAPLVYVTGEVGHPGSFALEPGMTIDQAIAVAGGVTPRGSIHRLRVTRKGDDGAQHELADHRLDTAVQPNDVITVRTRVF
jgi:polysaccharide export outer membrane protein